MWVGIGVAGFIAFVLLLLSVPFDLAMQLEVYGNPSFKLKWAWMFGLINKDLTAGARRAPKKKREKKRSSGINSLIIWLRTGSDYLRITGLIHKIILLVRQVLRRIQIRRLEAEFYAGLDDPADTFYIFALTEPFNLFFDRCMPYSVRLYPLWEGPVFKGHARADLRLYPIRLVLPMLGFLFSRPTFGVIKTAVVSRWKRRR